MSSQTHFVAVGDENPCGFLTQSNAHDDARAAGDEKPYVISTMRPNWSARCGGIFDENPCAFLLILAPRARTPTSNCLTLGGLSGWRRNGLMKGNATVFRQIAARNEK